MEYREAKELARIRQELRERLVSGACTDTAELVARFGRAARRSESAELLNEHARWRFRFECLHVAANTSPRGSDRPCLTA